MLISRPLKNKSKGQLHEELILWMAQTNDYMQRDPRKSCMNQDLIVRAYDHAGERVRATRAQLAHRHALPCVPQIIKNYGGMNQICASGNVAPFTGRGISNLRQAAAEGGNEGRCVG